MASTSAPSCNTRSLLPQGSYSTLSEAHLVPGFCAWELPVTITGARTVRALDRCNFLLIDGGQVAVIVDTNDDDVPDQKQIIATAPGLQHGLAVFGNYLYASSSDVVYRWPFSYSTTERQIFLNTSAREVVIHNMNMDSQGVSLGGHQTRTLEFDVFGRLYVAVGSTSNVDADSFRARIRRIPGWGGGSNTSDHATNLTFPIDFIQAEVFADGLRNEVGLAFDRHGVLWGVENGADKLSRTDLGGDIHDNNPAEELNRFPEELAGKHWGYPYCWTEYLLPPPYGKGRGTVWAWPTFLERGTISDEACRNEYTPPVVAMPAHSAPLGMVFYHYQDPAILPTNCTGTFPPEMDGFAFVTFHGSWNRDVPTGYKVVYVPMNASGYATGQPRDLLTHQPPHASWPDGFRPVGIDFDDCGRLIVSSDGTRDVGGSKVIRIEFIQQDQFTFPPSNRPTALPTFKPTTSEQRSFGHERMITCAPIVLGWVLVLIRFIR